MWSQKGLTPSQPLLLLSARSVAASRLLGGIGDKRPGRQREESQRLQQSMRQAGLQRGSTRCCWCSDPAFTALLGLGCPQPRAGVKPGAGALSLGQDSLWYQLSFSSACSDVFPGTAASQMEWDSSPSTHCSQVLVQAAPACNKFGARI